MKRPLRVTALLVTGTAALALAVKAILPAPVPAEVAVVDTGPLVVTVDEDGRTRVKDRYVVSAPIGGRLLRVALSPGDTVQAGAEVATILPAAPPLLDARSHAEARARVEAARDAVRQAEVAVERARTADRFAERDLERARNLASQKVISVQEFERVELEAKSLGQTLAAAEFATRAARHELELAEATAAAAEGLDAVRPGRALDVISPASGTVLKVVQQSEAVVAAGSPLLEIGDPLQIEVVVDVLTADAVAIAPSAPATIVRWGKDEPIAARVRLIEPSAFTKVSALGIEEQRVNVVLDLDLPEGVRLRDGYRVEARIETYRNAEAVRVPSGALFRVEDRWTVFVVEDGRARRRSVELGPMAGRAAEVKGGLRPGERVVVHPSDRIEDGARLAIAVPAP